MIRQPKLVCPDDRGELESAAGSGWVCRSCGTRYPEEDGVIRFLPQYDPFYEGTHLNQIRFAPKGEWPWQLAALWLVSSGYLWTVRRHVPKGSVVVELGCGGGVRYFGKRYRMVGCDVSVASLSKLRSVYAVRLHADAMIGIPIADSSVDAVVSSYFWEHIPPQSKSRILGECRRILKPGGKLVFLFDVETQNPLISRFRKKDPALYEREFLELDGHVGYETPAKNVEQFERAGFEVVECNGLEKTFLQSPSTYQKLASYGGAGGRLLARVHGLITGRLFYPYTLLVRATDALFGPWLPAAWARVNLVVCSSKDA